MAIAKTGSRVVAVNQQRFRWYIRRKPTYAQANAWTPLSVAVELADKPAQVLHVQFDVPRPDAWISSDSASVTPKVVAAAIRGALRAGWQPEVAGRPFKHRASIGGASPQAE